MKRWIWRRRPGPDQAGPHEHANKFPFYKSSEGYLRNFNEQSDVICDYKESHHDWTGQEQDGDRGASEKEGWGCCVYQRRGEGTQGKQEDSRGDWKGLVMDTYMI